MNRPVMFIPSNFTIDNGTSVTFRDCKLFLHEGWNMLHANVYKDHFAGDIDIEGYDIFTEDSPIVFMDKLEAYIKEEERILL